MATMQPILDFLRSQKLLSIATYDGEPWIANVYYAVGDDLKIYFVSAEGTRHSSHVLKHPRIAFTVAWFNPNNLKNRKAVQGLGTCRLATPEEIEEGTRLHNASLAQFKEDLTPERMRSGDPLARLWVIEPEQAKYWNDELYGDERHEDFQLSRIGRS